MSKGDKRVLSSSGEMSLEDEVDEEDEGEVERIERAVEESNLANEEYDNKAMNLCLKSVCISLILSPPQVDSTHRKQKHPTSPLL